MRDFINYNQALELRELGFDEPCLAVFNDSKQFRINSESRNWNNNVKNGDTTSAPLFQQAFRFFREKYGLHSSIDFQKLKESENDDDIALYEWRINEQWQVGKDWYDFTYGFKHHSIGFNNTSYEEAESACLDKLIELAKTK